MKKILPLVFGAVVVLVAVYFVASKRSQPGQVANAGTDVKSGTPNSVKNTNSGAAGATNADGGAGTEGSEAEAGDDGEAGDEGTVDTQEKTAVELYKSADEAIQAIKQASLSYDDLVLEQFTNIGDDCSWCPSFYQQVKQMMTSAEVNPEQRNYFAEVLAVSGKVDNVKTLLEAVKNAPSQEVAENFAQALELTVGKDDVVNLLGEHIGDDNATLREAVVAAVTNQGSRHAVDLLYKNTVERGDPDGMYSKGIGLGELVPEEDAIPRLQELMNQRDKYSHLAVKAILNSGAEGLKLVFDTLSNSKNADFDREMIKGAIDHVSWDEETMAVVDKVLASSPSPLVSEFANKIKEDLKQEETESNDGTGGEAATTTPPQAP